MNCINITGNIGNDLELRNTASGKRVLNISLAVRDRFNKEVTHWFPYSRRISRSLQMMRTLPAICPFKAVLV